MSPGERRARFLAVGRRLARSYLKGAGALTGASLVLGGLRYGHLGGLLIAAGGLALVSRSVTGRWVPRAQAPKQNGAGETAKNTDFPTWDEVDEAGVESFPASDPPAYSPR